MIAPVVPMPIDAFKIWDGGLGIWGAVAFGALGAWIGARRAGIKLPPFGDAIAPPILLAQAIGRLGNWFNQELYGKPTTVPWALEIYERSQGVSTGRVIGTYHPTFLYELLWDVLVVIILLVLDKKLVLGHGRLFASYVALYCLGRFWIELIRDDPATHILGLRVNTWVSGILFIAGLVYAFVERRPRISKRDIAALSQAKRLADEQHQKMSKKAS